MSALAAALSVAASDIRCRSSGSASPVAQIAIKAMEVMLTVVVTCSVLLSVGPVRKGYRLSRLPLHTAYEYSVCRTHRRHATSLVSDVMWYGFLQMSSSICVCKRLGVHTLDSSRPVVSKTPTANHRRPLPFGNAYVAERCGQSSATLSDCVFPEPLWEPFGEHGEEEEEGEDQEKGGGGGLLGHSYGLLGPSWGPPGGLLGASIGLLGAFGGFLGASLAVLGRSWPV